MARLHYAYCDQPGISRRALARGWAYFDAAGQRITDRAEIDRLNAIALPPAYRDAWFSPSPDAHILATGVDARGRKQYRYHPQFRARKESEKYRNCRAFGERLPALRRRVARDLRGRMPTAGRAIAAVVRLLDKAHARVGNDAYARDNGSFGATTLLGRHARTQGGAVRLRYKAKSGREREVALSDASLARFVRQMQDLPGQRLFQYLDGEGQPHPITSDDANAYIRESMGDDFTARHFRTWGASVAAFEAMVEAEAPLPLGALTEMVAQRLGNTPAIARKSYIHPLLIDIAQNRQVRWRKRLKLPRETRWLSAAERGLLRELKKL